MVFRWKALRVLCVLCLVAARVAARGSDSLAEPGAPLLAPGPFAVGFQSHWALDEGRSYRTAFDDGATYGATKAPRPVLVLAWYPAAPPREDEGEGKAGGAATPEAAVRMPYDHYFVLAHDDLRLAAFADALSRHARDIFVEQVMGAPESGLDDGQRAELASLLEAPTTCRPDAPAAPGPFPVVVYHSGAGSSFEDNAALCEFLASHGYVVLGSAYPKADGSNLGIDGGRGSAEDAQCLLRWARALPCADVGRVAFVGHSAGAQAFLRARAQPGCAADALVLLDTTQDYYALSLPLHEAVVREATEGSAQLTRPMLVVAGPEAVFAMCDTLVNAERFYFTVPDLGHDEYISQGHQRLQRIGRDAAARAATGAAQDAAAKEEAAKEEAAKEEAGEVARTPAVRATYRALCDTLLAFLDAQLRGDDAAFAAQLQQDAARPWTHTEPRLVHVPRGTSGPSPWDKAGSVPPTPRQFVRLLAEGGADDACAVLARFRDVQPRGPLYTSTMLAGSQLYDLSEHGRKDEARRYFAALKEIPLPALSLFSFLAEISQAQGKREQALRLLRLAHDLDPADTEVATSLKALEEAPAGAAR